MSSVDSGVKITYTEERPWGKFDILEKPDAVKNLTVLPGGILSLQRHKLRDEEWIVMEGDVEVTIGDQVQTLSPGQRVFIPRGTTHRAEAKKGQVVIRELHYGHFNEDDNERLEDVYGRKSPNQEK